MKEVDTTMIEIVSEIDHFSFLQRPTLSALCSRERANKDLPWTHDYMCHQRGFNFTYSTPEHTAPAGFVELAVGMPTRQCIESSTNGPTALTTKAVYQTQRNGVMNITATRRKFTPSLQNQENFKKLDLVKNVGFAKTVELSDTVAVDKPFPCTECGKAYGHKRGLVDHMMRAHADPRDPTVIAKHQARKDARVKNSAKKRKEPAYVQARKDSLRKARLVKKIKKKSPIWVMSGDCKSLM